MRKLAFWDQDGTVLRRPPPPEPLYVNPSVKPVLRELRQRGMRHYAFSAKAPSVSRERAAEAGLDTLFDGFIDARSRHTPRHKSIRTCPAFDTLTDDWLRRNAIIIGNSYLDDVVDDIDGLVHIINPFSMTTSFAAYGALMDSLGDDYSQGFDRLPHQLEPVQVQGASVLKFIKTVGNSQYDTPYRGNRQKILLVIESSRVEERQLGPGAPAT